MNYSAVHWHKVVRSPCPIPPSSISPASSTVSILVQQIPAETQDLLISTRDRKLLLLLNCTTSSFPGWKLCTQLLSSSKEHPLHRWETHIFGLLSHCGRNGNIPPLYTRLWSRVWNRHVNPNEMEARFPRFGLDLEGWMEFCQLEGKVQPVIAGGRKNLEKGREASGRNQKEKREEQGELISIKGVVGGGKNFAKEKSPC